MASGGNTDKSLGQREELETDRLLSLDTVLQAALIKRMRPLGEGREWIFQSHAGTPVTWAMPGHGTCTLQRQPSEVRIGGWHDSRHTLIRSLRRAGDRQTAGHF